jgi:hypothetical protein
MSFPTPTGDAVEGQLMREMQVCLGPAFANSTYQFNLTGTSTAANVYQDGNLTTPFPITGFVSADNFGRFPPIYLDPSIIYQVNFNGPNGYTWQRDPYTPPLSTNGTSQNTAYGMQVAPTGEITVTAPNAGGTGLSMKVSAGQLGTAALRVSSTQAGQAAIIVNSSATTGAQTATFTATNKPGTATSSPAGWLPIICDAVTYFTPIWHGNNFSPYVATPGAVGEVINAANVTFNGNGSTTATGGTAVPGSWFLPNQTSIGTGYYIQITKTGGLSGLAFSIGNTITNIGAGGLTVTSNGSAPITGTYIISTSVTGTPVVASGTITLSGGNGVQNPTWNGVENFVLAGNGTATLNGVTTSPWYTPTTGSIGASYWISIVQTGGTSGYSFSGVSSNTAAPTNIGAGGLTISITPVTGTSFFVSGNYYISSDSGGVNVVATGTITLTGGNPIQSPNWSGTAPLNLAGNGTATLNGVGTSSWYSPTTANVGSGYWIDITRTGGTSGVNFSKAQGSWTNITNSGLSISITGTSGKVGTATASGTWQISSSASGTPVLGSGTISLSISGLTLIHIYTTGTAATETIQTGSSNAAVECWAGGGSGGIGGAINPGGGGAAGGYARRTISVTGQAGHTFTYTVGPGGAASANPGSASSVNAGTVTGWTNLSCNGGGGGNYSAGASGGTASGGTTNTTGASVAANTRAAATGTTGNISGDGSPYGGGGSGGLSNGQAGNAGLSGAVVFFYS